MITQRDKAVIDFISKFQVATTSTLKELFYPSLRIAQRRLAIMVKHQEIKREREHFNNEYIYYMKKPKQLQHRLLLTQFYKAIVKLGLDVVSFENEVTIEDLRADGLLAYKYKNKGYIAFIEVQISNKALDIDKYKRLFNTEKYKHYFPVFPKLIAITNQNVPQIKDFRIIQVREDMSNIKDLIGGI